ncbi:MAG: polysaccharide deacetylase family protein [Chloroflexi bacterium]|nr:polysaccharide deacetylase family protein [Chloroflexota bacterium]
MIKRVWRKLQNVSLRSWLGTVTHVSTQENVAALTFDDGPHPEFTPQLLEILARHQAQATFFVVGQSAKQHPELLHQMAAAGHAIGNHTWDHPSLPLISRRERKTQIRACDELVASYGHCLFRPPFGHLNLAARFDLFRLGYQVVTWNLKGIDWLDHDSAWLVARLTQEIRPGSIILLHDALYQFPEKRFANRTPTLEAVDTLLQQLKGTYRFVTVPELLKFGKPAQRVWIRRADTQWLNKLQDAEGHAARQYVPS